MVWELVLLGCDALAAWCSLMAAIGFLTLVGGVFVSIAFVRNAANTPTRLSSPKRVRIITHPKLKPSIKL